jgi:hypothetical protein
MTLPQLHRVEPADVDIDAANSGALVKIGESCALGHSSSERPADDRTYKFPTSARDARNHVERLTSYFMVCFRSGKER